MEWAITACHALLALALVVGVLFSNTKTQHIAILITLVVLLFGIRYNDGCCVTPLEGNDKNPTLSAMGKAFYLRDAEDAASVRDAVFEELVVANLTFLHLLRIAASSILPPNHLLHP